MRAGWSRVNGQALAALAACALLAGCPKSPVQVPDAPALARAEADPWAVLGEGAAALEPGVRARALAALITHSPEPGGGPWGPRALYDPEDWVRLEASRALAGRLPEPEAAGLLRALLTRAEVDPTLRGLSGLALARHGAPDLLPLLLRLMAEQPRRWQAAAFALPAAVLGDAGALAQLTEVVRRGDLPLRLEFVLECGRSGLPGLGEAFLEGLERTEEELVLPMAAAAALLGEPRAEGLLRQALGGELEQQLEAVDLLDRVNADFADELLRRARTSGDPAVAQRAALALLARGQSGPEPALEALQSADRELRQQAARALGRAWSAGDEASRRDARRVRQALLAALVDPDEAVRAEAARALGQVGDGAGGALLAGRMGEEELALRVALAEAILALTQSP